MWHAYSEKKIRVQQQNKYWHDYRKHAKQKRQDNCKKSLKILQDAKIQFTFNTINKSCNIITNKGNVIFYPTTGTFNGAYQGRGVFQLIKKIT